MVWYRPIGVYNLTVLNVVTMKSIMKRLLLIFASVWLLTDIVAAASPIIENSGALKLGGLPSGENGLYVLVSSPGTPSPLVKQDMNVPLAAVDDCLICRGATLAGTSDAERISLGTCALVAGALVVDGITMGDLQAGLANSRHGRTLTALFRARVMLAENSSAKQTLILVVHGSDASMDKDAVVSEAKSLFEAVAAEKSGSTSFEDSYEVFVTSVEDESKVRVCIRDSASSSGHQ